MASALAGCGGGGGGGGSSLPPMNTTITGFLTPPAVTAPAIAASVRGLTSDQLLAKFAASGACTVNGQAVAFSLATATKYFQIPEIPTASFYDVKFTYQNLVLRVMVPHESTYMYNKDVNIESTIRAWLMEQYRFTATQMANWEIKQEYVTAFKDKFTGWLLTPGETVNTLSSRLNNELASFTTHVPVGSLTSDLTPAVDLTGTWKGRNCVFYNLNLYGQRAYKVTGDVTMTLKQSGNTVTGVISIDVTKNELMPGIDLGAPEPDHLGSSIVNGKISSTRFTFTVGKESWEFTTLSDMMSGKVSNLDKNMYLGIESDAGAFSLQRQW